jgi:hypothetical protein
LDWVALDACELEGRIAHYGVADDDAVFGITGFTCSASFRRVVSMSFLQC